MGKERDEADVDTVFQGSTLFISNLPYTATSVDLQTLFSDIAPVRSAFVVLDKDTGKSKGVGYVSFAIKEDAAMAVDHIKNNGITLDKRLLRVQFADKKVTHTQDEATPVSNAKRPKLTPKLTSKFPANPNAVRTIVISGLPNTIDAKALWKKVRKLDGAKEISQWPGKNASGDQDLTVAEVLFSTPALAQDAILRLHAHVFKGSLLSVVLKKRLETLAKSNGNPSRANRLIIRNLPWNATEDSLRRIFLPYGPIHSITIPVAEPDKEGGHPRAKGFGFVWMMNKSDAEKAIEGANGITLGSGKEGDLNAKDRERVIAVDWALSKERWEAEKKTMDAAHESNTGSSHSDSEDSDSETDGDHVGVHQGSDRESEDEASSDPERSDDEEVAERPRLPPPETGNTIFIRNVPFDATEDELRTLFRSYGPLRYARITLDPSTGRSRGTGFVCFWNREDADKAIQQAELMKIETGGLQDPRIAMKNPFKMSSILTHDPSSSLAQNLVMHGRTLDITRAVTREEAGKLRELGEKQRQKQDKRNLYLMREGVIFPNTPSATELSPADVEKRVQAFNTRRALLKSNPSLYISKTRLSVRQIPLFASERTLKRLALHAVRAFDGDVKKGVKDGLTAEELHEDEPQGDGAAENGEETLIKKRKRKQGERYTPVRQVKIVRVSDRVDAVTGKGRSKGYGFVEMMSHADALRVLRWANNNPDVERLMKGWWKDELQDLLKRLDDGQKKTNEEQAKINRIKDRIKELDEVEKSKKIERTLVLEFSIENVQVVRRRSERKVDKKLEDEKPLKPKRKADPDPSQEDDHRPTKKPKKSAPASEPSGTKPGAEMGSLIGRKRRQKKSQKKA